MTKFANQVDIENIRSILQDLFKLRMSEREIARELQCWGYNISRSTIHRKLAQFKCACRGGKSLHNVSLDSEARLLIRRMVLAHQAQTPKAIQQYLFDAGYDVSRSTVVRALHSDNELVFRRPRRKPIISRQQRLARKKWADEVNIDWKNVYFVDEKAWSLDGPDWRQGLWQGKHQPAPILLRRGRHQPRVVVFGAFSVDNAPPLVRIKPHYNSADYCQAVEACLPRGAELIHDRHPVHLSKETRNFFSSPKMSVLAHAFPPPAADVNPIENLWGLLTRKVYAGRKVYSSTDVLWSRVQRAWADVQCDQQLRATLAGSMHSRLEELVKNKGGPIRY